MIPTVLAEALAIIGVDPAVPDDGELELSSLQVLMLVEHLENALGLIFDGADVTRENFASKATLAHLLAKKSHP